MKWKSWIRRYGIHIAVCAAILAVAFGINQKINLERSHVYTLEESVYTLLKEMTQIKEEEDSLIFFGWGFDTNYYNDSSRCELILQDTETGEALWPKMKNNVESVEIDERYTGGEDYSESGFEGDIKVSKLKEDSVYEILLRYTSKYTDEAGMEQQYVRTVTTDEFLYQGEAEGYEIAEYNPKTFKAPEIAGTELEKELEGAKLFHWFEEGLWIYYDMPRVYYVAEKSCIDSTKPLWFPCFWQEKNVVEQEGQVLGKGLVTFPITQNERLYETIDDYRIWCSEMPSEKVVQIMTGLYLTGEEEWLLSWTGQIKE